MGALMRVSNTFVTQAYHMYFQALELVHLLDTDAVPNIDDVQQVSLALRRLVTINSVNKYYGYDIRIVVPPVGKEGNC